MILEYDELKEAVLEDFERFSEWGFNAKQIYPATLDEYRYGGYSKIKDICIHMFIVLNYAENNLVCDEVIDNLKRLLDDTTQTEIKNDLGDEYPKYVKDLHAIMEKYKDKLSE